MVPDCAVDVLSSNGDVVMLWLWLSLTSCVNLRLRKTRVVAAPLVMRRRPSRVDESVLSQSLGVLTRSQVETPRHGSAFANNFWSPESCLEQFPDHVSRSVYQNERVVLLLVERVHHLYYFCSRRIMSSK